MEHLIRQSYHGKIKMVIFDWAGTTVDYGCFAPAEVFIQVFQKKGINISIQQARQPMGLGKREHIIAITELSDVTEKWKEVYGRSVSKQDIDEMYTDFQPLQMQCLADYSQLIPGTLETTSYLRQHGIKIGSTTGYFKEALDLLVFEAGKQGFNPDLNVCVTDVPRGRPEPWMVFENMIKLGIYPPVAVVKVDDTKPGIAEGLNAGVWTIGVAQTGNEMGLSINEVTSLSPEDLQQRLARIRLDLRQAGAHFVINAIAEIPAIIEQINKLLSIA